MFDVQGSMIRITRGDTGLLSLTGKGRSLTANDRVVLTVARKTGFTIYKNAVQPVNGIAQFIFLNQKTAKWPAGEYRWDVRVVLDAVVSDGEIIAGREVATPFRPGRFVVLEAVGRIAFTGDATEIAAAHTASMTIGLTQQEGGVDLSIVSLRGPQGPAGEKGERGPAGENGKDYVLTQRDKAEIAEKIEGATVVQAPAYVGSVDDMTDTGRVYVLADTGRIWAFMDTAAEETVTVRDEIIATADNPYETGRLSSGGANSGDVSTHTITPFIDLTKPEYQGKTIRLHLDGNRYVTEAGETYIMSALFDADKNALLGRGYSSVASGGTFDAFEGETVVINDTTSATLTIPVPLTHSGTGSTIAYMRFCGLGTVRDSVWIEYETTQMVTGGQWVDTGTTYAPTLTEEEKQAMADEVASMVDAQLLTMIGDGTVTA